MPDAARPSARGPRRHPIRPRLVAGGTLVAVTATIALVATGASSSQSVGRSAAAADVGLAVALDRPLQRSDVATLLTLTRAALDQPTGPAHDREARLALGTRERLLRAIGSVLRNPRSGDLERLAVLERETTAAMDALGSRAVGDLGRFDTRELRRLSLRRRVPAG